MHRWDPDAIKKNHKSEAAYENRQKRILNHRQSNITTEDYC
ncbi:hypothetical protein SynBIOSU31_00992 [Synechococcus sp. BIOS-U3-1]|nr:hypothetical protein SynBIOSU31_00992 [Synechococcus sp. BIOS-U3-1]